MSSSCHRTKSTFFETDVHEIPLSDEKEDLRVLYHVNVFVVRNVSVSGFITSVLRHAQYVADIKLALTAPLISTHS